jgi:PIN domain nuclease of toxin-antitoxin system
METDCPNQHAARDQRGVPERRFDLGGQYQIRLGQIEADPNEVLAGVEPAGFNHLPVVGGPAAKVVELPPIHKDLFDRLLVAQARYDQ